MESSRLEFYMITTIKVRCIDCGSSDTCPVKTGKWLSEWEGCFREVPAEFADKFFYYTAELKPMLLRRKQFEKDKELWKELFNFLEELDGLPHGRRYRYRKP